MDGGKDEWAEEPEDLGRLFLERANRGDVEGIVALYEPDAVLATPDGRTGTGHPAIRQFYERLLEIRPSFTGEVRPALCVGNVALTSTRFATGATAEVARRQLDNSWLWAIDQPDVLR